MEFVTVTSANFVQAARRKFVHAICAKFAHASHKQLGHVACKKVVIIELQLKPQLLVAIMSEYLLVKSYIHSLRMATKSCGFNCMQAICMYQYTGT